MTVLIAILVLHLLWAVACGAWFAPAACMPAWAGGLASLGAWLVSAGAIIAVAGWSRTHDAICAAAPPMLLMGGGGVAFTLGAVLVAAAFLVLKVRS